MTGARTTARQLRDTRGFRALARSGFVMNGVLHIIIGAIAVGIAFGASGEADQSGAFEQLAGTPVGLVALVVITIGLWALGLFEVVTVAITRGSEADAWKDRAKTAGRAIAYLAIGFTAFRFATGSGGSSSQQSQSLSAKLLASPGGVVLLVVLGLAVVAVGGYFVVKGVTHRFERTEIAVPAGTIGRVIGWLGVVGFVAQGVAFVVVGVLFIVAAVTADPEKATGLDGALSALRDLPAGPFVLCAIALGIILYGGYLFGRARYAKL
jgi:hypothetical protein